jgi:hypothetical protein
MHSRFPEVLTREVSFEMKKKIKGAEIIEIVRRDVVQSLRCRNKDEE